MNIHSLLLCILRVVELAACVAAFATWGKWRNTPWRWFAFFLLFVVFAECVGAYTFKHSMVTFKTIFFNYILIPIEYLTIHSMFFAYNRTRREKAVTLSFAAIYLISLAMSAVLSKALPETYYSISITMGNVLVLILIILYFIRLVDSNEIMHVKRNMMFFACTGWLLFYIATLPFYGMGNTLLEHYPHAYFLYSNLTLLLNTGMYLCYLVGYLWTNPKY